MQCFQYFPTNIWFGDLDLDNDRLKKVIKDFVKSQESVVKSNRGGYQGHDFNDEIWCNTIASSIPHLEEKPFNAVRIFSWVNINSNSDYNTRHSHFNTSNFLSGVYYVSVPENSGKIGFYDPRPWMTDTPDNVYFHGGHRCYKIQPEEGMVIFFPPWLEHDVEPNKSNEERISIAFNVQVDGYPDSINT